MGVKLEPWEVPEGPLNRADLEKEYKNRFVEPVGALLVTADSFFNNNREVIVDILIFLNYLQFTSGANSQMSAV